MEKHGGTAAAPQCFQVKLANRLTEAEAQGHAGKRAAMKIITVGNSNVGKTVFITHVFGKQRLDPATETKVTLGFDASTIHVKDPTTDTMHSITLYDTAGQERFARLTSGYMRKVDGILLMFDVTNAESFADITLRWVPEIVRTCGMDYNPGMPSVSDIEEPTVRQVRAECDAAAALPGGRHATPEEIAKRVRDGVAGEYMRYIGTMHMPIVLVGNKSDLSISRCVSTAQGVQLAERMGVAYCECSARTESRDLLSIVVDALVNMILANKSHGSAGSGSSSASLSPRRGSGGNESKPPGPRVVVFTDDGGTVVTNKSIAASGPALPIGGAHRRATVATTTVAAPRQPQPQPQQQQPPRTIPRPLPPPPKPRDKVIVLGATPPASSSASSGGCCS